MSKGRKIVPTHLKAVKGTLRPCRVNDEAPSPVVGFPVAPVWLDPLGTQYFGALVGKLDNLRLASPTFTETIALAADRLAEIVDCKEHIRDHGRVYQKVDDKTGEVTLKANPAVAQLNEARRHLQSLLAELGLTPASISKIKAPGAGKESNPWAEFG